MRERGLTVRDRIVVHLSGYSRFADDYECPEEVCQSGISHGVGKSRAHITLELNRMVREEIVSERTARVKGMRSKRKVYFLASKGLARSAEMDRHLETLNINVTGPDCKGPMTGTEAVAYLLRNGQATHSGAVELVMSSGGSLNLSGSRPSMPTGRFLPPRQEDFIPRPELRELMSMLGDETPNTVILLGISGTGKTALLTELAWRLDRGTDVFYMRLYPYDSAQTVLRQLTEFLRDLGLGGTGPPGLHGNCADLDEAGMHISDCMRRRKLVLIFDGYESAPSLDPLFAMLSRVADGSGSGIGLASDTKPGFYSVKEVRLGRSVREFRIGGLGCAESLKLFRDSGGRGPEDCLKAAGGNPLLIKLLASGCEPGTLMEYAESDIIGKDTELARACRFASVLRKPISAEDMELLGTASASAVRRSLAFEAQPGGGYMLHPAVAAIMGAALNARMLEAMHSSAAKHYAASGAEPHEAVYHIVKSGDTAKARSFLIEHGRDLEGTDNPEELADLIESAVRAGDASTGLLETAARVCDAAGKGSALAYAQEIARRTGSSPEGQRARLLCARILMKRGEFAEADKSLGRVPPTEKSLSAEWHYARASLLRRRGRLKSALAECENAESDASDSGNAALRAECMMESAMILSGLGENERALGRLAIAMSEFVGCDNCQDTVRCGINTGIVLRELGCIREASDALETAVAKAGRMGRSRLRAQGLANLTEVLNLLGEYRRAAELAGQAAWIFSGLGEPVMLSVSKFNRGTALAHMSQNSQAAEEFEEAVRLLRSLGMQKARRGWILDAAKLLDGMGDRKRAARFRKLAG